MHKYFYKAVLDGELMKGSLKLVSLEILWNSYFCVFTYDRRETNIFLIIPLIPQLWCVDSIRVLLVWCRPPQKKKPLQINLFLLVLDILKKMFFF